MYIIRVSAAFYIRRFWFSCTHAAELQRDEEEEHLYIIHAQHRMICNVCTGATSPSACHCTHGLLDLLFGRKIQKKKHKTLFVYSIKYSLDCISIKMKYSKVEGLLLP